MTIWDPNIEIPARLITTGPGVGYCPGHKDDSPSLSFAPGRGGSILLHCNRKPSCSIEAITAAIGLTVRDLFPRNGGSLASPVAPAKRIFLPSTSPKRPAPKEIAVEAHELRNDLNRQVIVQLAIKLDHIKPNGKHAKTFSYERPAAPGKRVRLRDVGLTPADLPLWGSELLSRHPEKPVIICEGVKAAKAVRRADAAKVFITLASVAGAGVTPAWHVLRPLAQRDLILWADADQAGEDHMDDIAAWAPARSVRFIRIPNAQTGDDAHEFFQAGGTLKQMIDHVGEA
jgi:hypothetical protein